MPAYLFGGRFKRTLSNEVADGGRSHDASPAHAETAARHAMMGNAERRASACTLVVYSARCSSAARDELGTLVRAATAASRDLPLARAFDAPDDDRQRARPVSESERHHSRPTAQTCSSAKQAAAATRDSPAVHSGANSVGRKGRTKSLPASTRLVN